MKIAVSTTTRADWGLLSLFAAELRRRGAEIAVMAGNMHFDESLGSTWCEIEADGFPIAARMAASGTAADIFAATAQGAADAFRHINPDAVIVLGDRSESLAVAAQALIAGVPIVHIAGGAVSEGAIDDSVRHAITKLSTLHLVETEEYRRRVIAMGEDPATVIRTGAIGAEAALATDMSREELEESLDFALGARSLLVTLHAATRDPISPHEAMRNLITSLESYTATHKIIFTYPNNDVDPALQIALIEEFAGRHREAVCALPSLGRRRYLAALHCVEAVVGNSSSGLVEVPSAGIPTLDIGSRQQGRTAGESVVHCGASAKEIAAGLRKVLSAQVRDAARKAENPYLQHDAVGVMADAVMRMPLDKFPIKHFYEIH